MRSKNHLAIFALVTFVLTSNAADALDRDWEQPPRDARLRAYWWWLNGNVTAAAITRDLEAMRAKGFGGALICDADGSSQDGNVRVPHGPTFFSPAWRELFRHTLREADRLGLEMSLNIQSGWNLGGPMVAPEDAPKKLVWTETQVKGRTNLNLALPQPQARENFYRDLFIVAFPSRQLAATRQPLLNHREKALLAPLKPFSAPDSTPLFRESPASTEDPDARTSDVLDLTSGFQDGHLQWAAPEGDWTVLRIGFTLNDHCRVSTCSEGWNGYAIDPFDAGAFTRYWDAVVAPLIADAGPLAGKTLKYLHTDSWEVEVANWTPTLRAEFRKRRGYDLLPWLPVIAGKILNSRDESNRFLYDFRRTMGDLAIDHHYKLFKDRAHAHGLLIHPESGGPHAVPIDAQQCLGFNDAPMSEFWAWSWRHRIGDENRFFVKQPASAAHAYGRKLVLAEGFTTIGPHWQETLWDNLKPSFDHALTEGLNLLVWHAFVCSPTSAGIPGQQYFAGTHLNPNVTWWEKSGPFFAYINRCQALLQSGLPVSDVAYYYGSGVPNFAQLRKSDPARLGGGFDYDVVTDEVLLERMRVRDGRLVLPEGVSYRVLALPDRKEISLPVLRKIADFVAAGATVIGPKPRAALGLTGYPESDTAVHTLANQLWDSGRIQNVSARERLRAMQINPDFDWAARSNSASPAGLDYIHRQTPDAEIYFVSNRATNSCSVDGLFRVTGRTPEIWDAVTGEKQFVRSTQQTNGYTRVPLEFTPSGSWFVLFRKATTEALPATHPPVSFRPLLALTNAWTVRFDPQWGGPIAATFPKLISWTERKETGIRFYSGTATYEQSITLPPVRDLNSPARIFLNLGAVHELAEVRLNGKSCGITWTPPFRVELSASLQPGTNQLEVDVVNFWPNRIIGDATLPEEKRLTRTNIRKLTSDTRLMTSGLLGPVVVETLQ